MPKSLTRFAQKTNKSNYKHYDYCDYHRNIHEEGGGFVSALENGVCLRQTAASHLIDEKKRADYANMDESKFTEIDKSQVKTITIDSKKPKLITEKPDGTYTLTDNGDGTTTLEITNVDAFWASSPYLIIQK